MKKQEYIKYKVNDSFGSCRSLDKIFHVSHVQSALNIVSERKIKAGLVYDESKLKEHRILICWLSPNEWDGAGGSRYGNISFEFDWKDICEGMNYYWVEVIDYRPKALRILVTKNNYDDLLEPYYPESKDGPWWYDKNNDQHHWNGNYCLEIMVERDISIREVISVDFVDHHHHRCCLSTYCNELGNMSYSGGALFIAGIVGQNIKYRLPDFYKIIDDEIEVNHKFGRSCDVIKNFINNLKNFEGNISASNEASAPLARAIMYAYAFNENDAYKLATLFKSKNSLLRCCKKLIADNFNIPDWKSIFPKPKKRG